MNAITPHAQARSGEADRHRRAGHGRPGRRRAGRLDRGARGEGQGWIAQSTSVPGVAQRTGATIYYIEMVRPRADQAARAVADAGAGRGRCRDRRRAHGGRSLHTARPRHALIARRSSHRRIAPMRCRKRWRQATASATRGKVYDAALASAKRFIAFDMAALAEASGSVISAVLFGALAGSGALPFRARGLSRRRSAPPASASSPACAPSRLGSTGRSRS